jgi:hypothetical protein
MDLDKKNNSIQNIVCSTASPFARSKRTLLDNSFLRSLRSLRAIFSHRKNIDPTGASDYFVVLHIIKKKDWVRLLAIFNI